MSERGILECKPIGVIHTDFADKFGVPRQSGLVPELLGYIELEPEYRQPGVYKGIEEFSHLWLLWGFSANKPGVWSPTVYPPRLGGKESRGVFATRSPFRPNPIGLSSVRLERVDWEAENGPVLVVSGVDVMDGTPVYDIKPYLPYADAHPEAEGGFGQQHSRDGIKVVFPRELLERLPREKQDAARRVLEQDPRAAYNKKPDYVYGMQFAGYDIRFRVRDEELVVCDVVDTGIEDWEKVK